MERRIQQALLTLGVVGALSGGGAAIANAASGTSTTSTPTATTPAPTTPTAPSTGGGSSANCPNM